MSATSAPAANAAVPAPPKPGTRESLLLNVGFFAMVVGMFMAILDIQIVSASLAEIQAGSIYYYFDSKSAILDEVLDEGLRRVFNGVKLKLKQAGDIRAYGMGINTNQALEEVATQVDLDFCLVAMPYTLLDQESLTRGMKTCLDRGVSVSCELAEARRFQAERTVEFAT